MRQYAGYSHDPGIKKQRQERAETHDRMAIQLDGMPAHTTPMPASNGSLQAAESPADTDYDSEVMALIEESSIRWNDIGGLESHQAGYQVCLWVGSGAQTERCADRIWRNLLFFGPPGTGKTLLAAATAGSLEAVFFNVKVSNVLSKYFRREFQVDHSFVHHRPTPQPIRHLPG